MSNWWLQWAERIALVLAERWSRSLAAPRGEAPEARDLDAGPAASDPAPDSLPPGQADATAQTRP